MSYMDHWFHQAFHCWNASINSVVLTSAIQHVINSNGAASSMVRSNLVLSFIHTYTPLTLYPLLVAQDSND
jgi:hypothetical protein